MIDNFFLHSGEGIGGSVDVGREAIRLSCGLHETPETEARDRSARDQREMRKRERRGLTVLPVMGSAEFRIGRKGLRGFVPANCPAKHAMMPLSSLKGAGKSESGK